MNTPTELHIHTHDNDISLKPATPGHPPQPTLVIPMATIE